MIFETLKEKYGLSESEVKILCNSMTRDLGLEETRESINESLELRKIETLTVDQVYALASALCKDMFEEHINEVAPQIAKDKMLLNSKKSDNWQENKRRNKEISRLRAIAEDIALYEREQRDKAQ